MLRALTPLLAILMAGGMAACASTSLSPSPSQALEQASNADIAREFERRTLELLRRPPPKFSPPESDTKAREAYLAEMRDKNSDLGKYAQQFFADHLIFAEARDPRSIYNVAGAYWTGWDGTVEIDPCKSLYYAFKSAELGQDAGMEILAEAYMTGKGLPQDHPRANFWALELIHNGYPLPLLFVSPAYGPKFLKTIEQSRKDWPDWNKYRDLKLEPDKICQEKAKE